MCGLINGCQRAICGVVGYHARFLLDHMCSSLCHSCMEYIAQRDPRERLYLSNAAP